MGHSPAASVMILFDLIPIPRDEFRLPGRSQHHDHRVRAAWDQAEHAWQVELTLEGTGRCRHLPWPLTPASAASAATSTSRSTMSSRSRVGSMLSTRVAAPIYACAVGTVVISTLRFSEVEVPPCAYGDRAYLRRLNRIDLCGPRILGQW